MSTQTKREHRPIPEILDQISALLLTPNDQPRYKREVVRRSVYRGANRRAPLSLNESDA